MIENAFTAKHAFCFSCLRSEQENKDFDSEEDLPVFNNETELKTYDVIKHTTQNENIDPTPVDLNSNSVKTLNPFDLSQYSQ